LALVALPGRANADHCPSVVIVGGAYGLLAGGISSAIATPIVAFGTERNVDGGRAVFAPLVGAGIGTVIGAYVIGGTVCSKNKSNPERFALSAVPLGIMGAIAGAVLVWYNSPPLPGKQAVPDDSVSLGIIPLDDGGLLTLSARF